MTKLTRVSDSLRQYSGMSLAEVRALPSLPAGATFRTSEGWKYTVADGAGHLSTAGANGLNIELTGDIIVGQWGVVADGALNGTGTDNADALINMRNVLLADDPEKHRKLILPDGRIIYSNNRWKEGLVSYTISGYRTVLQCSNTRQSVGDNLPFGPREGIFRLGGDLYFADESLFIKTGDPIQQDTVYGSSTISLAAGYGSYSVGDRVFIHGFAQQRKGYSPNLRFFEWNEVVAVAGNTLTLQKPLKYKYYRSWPDFYYAEENTYNGVTAPAQYVGKPRVLKLNDRPQVDGTTYTYPKYARVEGVTFGSNVNSNITQSLTISAEVCEIVDCKWEGYNDTPIGRHIFPRECKQYLLQNWTGHGLSIIEFDKLVGTCKVVGGSLGADVNGVSLKAGTGVQVMDIEGVDCAGSSNVTAIESVKVHGCSLNSVASSNTRSFGPVMLYYPSLYAVRSADFSGNLLTKLDDQSVVGLHNQVVHFDLDFKGTEDMRFVWSATEEPPLITRRVHVGQVIWKKSDPMVRGTVTSLVAGATYLQVVFGKGNLLTSMPTGEEYSCKIAQRLTVDGEEVYPAKDLMPYDPGLLKWEEMQYTGDDFDITGTEISGDGTGVANTSVSFGPIVRPGKKYRLTYDCNRIAGAIYIRGGSGANLATINASVTGGTVEFTVPASISQLGADFQITHLAAGAFEGTFTPVKLEAV